MRLRAYVLFLVLTALVGLCAVHERVVETRTRYRLAELLAEEERLKEELTRLHGRTVRLASPARLEALNNELDLHLTPMQPVAVAEDPAVEGRSVAWGERGAAQ